MIIACPACATRYVVPDSAIGLEGRTVRCAKCKHSWYQDGPELVEPIAAAYSGAAGSAPASPPAAPPPVQDRSAAAPSPPITASPPPQMASDGRTDDIRDQDEPVPPAWTEEDDAEVEAEAEAEDAPVVPPTPQSPPEPGFAVVAGDHPAPPPLARDEDEPSPFDHAPPFRQRRNWLRWLTWGAGAFAALAIAAVVAMSVLGTPSWLPIEKPLFGADPGLTVEFPASEQERRQLPNGAEFFGARVVVKNETRETKRVPPLLIVLRDARERVVYSWEMVPPQRTLAPGEAMTINEAMTDVPKSATYADIGWAPR